MQCAIILSMKFSRLIKFCLCLTLLVGALSLPVSGETSPLNDLVNEERVAVGAPKLKLNSYLNHSAQDKCIDMQQKNYWSHDTPTGEKFWVFIDNYTTYEKSGENLAKGFSNDGAVVTGWMNSPKHKEAMLNPSFTDVGYGVCDFRGGKLVVQHLKY